MTDRQKTFQDKRPGIMTRLLLRLSVSKRVDGLWIGVFDDKPVQEPALGRVEEALCLIKTYDRRRYERLLCDIERVWVLQFPGGRAQFDCSIWACKLDPRYVLDKTKSPEQIAASIVHEATHARLWRRGIEYQENLRSRVEAVCVRRERAFATRIPNGEHIREQADSKLATCANQDYWTNEAFRARHEKGVIKIIAHAGSPDWWVRFLLAIRSLRLRLARVGSGPAGS